MLTATNQKPQKSQRLYSVSHWQSGDIIIIIRLVARLYWIHFTGGVQAFGYNSAESEPI